MASDPLIHRELGAKGHLRRRELARAGARILRVSGIEALTHRAAAEQAGVPLGSTTYYFTSRDDLLEAAVEYATERSIAWIVKWSEDNSGVDLAVSLPEMLHRYLTDQHAVAAYEVELYVLAARRPELRVYTTRWTAAFIDVLAEFIPRDAAAHVAATFNGLILINVASTLPVSLSELRRILAAAMGRPADMSPPEDSESTR
jgi:DNA-binding transcriptional regulator YbjK